MGILPVESGGFESMIHDIQLTERANREQADMLLVALGDLCRDDGEPWQQQEREARLRELRAELLGEE